MEILEWALQNDARVVATLSASNVLLFLYVMSYALTKKAVFLTAFLFVEFYGNSQLFSVLDDHQYYLGYAFIYSIFYFIVIKQNQMLKTSFGYGILLIFELAMVADALFYPESETYIYSSYTSVVVFVHLYIITTLINWKLLFRVLGATFNAVVSRMGFNYSLSFYMYNKFIYKQKSKKQ